MIAHVSKFVMFAAAALALHACDESRAPTEPVRAGAFAARVASSDLAGRYLVVFVSERVPTDIGERISRLGGAVESALDSVGVATVTGLSEAAAAELASQSDVRNVEQDEITRPRNDAENLTGEALAQADATASPTSAEFYARQWNMRAVFAPEAWAAGHVGSRDVKVAILDTGIDYLHPDLVGLVDLEHSISLVPEAPPTRYSGRLPFSDFHQHGTFVASIIASNGRYLAGLNRYVTLLAVKTDDSTNSSTAGLMLAGIVYAADQGADVINLSSGVQRDRSVSPGTIVAFERAVSYAFRKGALLVSLPFNDGADLDHNGNFVRLPCEVGRTLCVAATGPTSTAGIEGPWQNVDAPAWYSAFGRSAVDVAAPGGNGPPTTLNVPLACTTTPTQTTGRPDCRARRPVGESRGTSFAAPHVAGLAALLVAKHGKGKPALIRARILESADDLGEPGTDPYYGKGRVNIARALGVIE